VKGKVPSRGFDRAADFYDSTRELAAPVAKQGIPAILDQAGPGARFLDVGTGTGRIAVPLLQRGANLIGCDLSSKMMARLRQKFPAALLVQADAAHLPFPSHHFDALLTCHVMHLVGPWRIALREFSRVIKPGGVYINARTERKAHPQRERIRTFWQTWTAAHGLHVRRPGVQNAEELLGELGAMGATVTSLEVVRYTRHFTLREEIEAITKRIHSSSWEIPEDIFAAGALALGEWVAQEYGNVDLDQAIEEEALFVLDLARFGP